MISKHIFDNIFKQVLAHFLRTVKLFHLYNTNNSIYN